MRSGIAYPVVIKQVTDIEDRAITYMVRGQRRQSCGIEIRHVFLAASSVIPEPNRAIAVLIYRDSGSVANHGSIAANVSRV